MPWEVVKTPMRLHRPCYGRAELDDQAPDALIAGRTAKAHRRQAALRVFWHGQHANPTSRRLQAQPCIAPSPTYSSATRHAKGAPSAQGLARSEARRAGWEVT